MKTLMLLILSLLFVSCNNGDVLDELAINDIPEVEYNRSLEGKIRRLGYQIKKINEGETKERMSVARRTTFDRKMKVVKDSYENLIDFIAENESEEYEKQVMLEYQNILMNLEAIKTNYPVDKSYNSVGANL